VITDQAVTNKVDINKVDTSKADISKVVTNKEVFNKITINRVAVTIHKVVDINKVELADLMSLAIVLVISKLPILPILIIPRHNSKPLTDKIHQMIMARILLVVIPVLTHMD
jgi:hypothetical protein